MTEQEEFEFRHRLEQEHENEQVAKVPSAERMAFLSDPHGSQDTAAASVRGAINAVTLKHMPQIAGAMSHPIGAVKALVGSGQEDPDVQAYEGERNAYRDMYGKAKKEHPTAYGAGEIAGFVAGPGQLLNGLKGAQGLAVAGGLGAAAGEGGSEGNYSTGDYGQIAKDAAIDGGLGVGGQLVGEHVLSPVGQYISKKLKDSAIGAAIRHLRPTPSVSRALGKEGMNDVAQEALDAGAIRPFQKVGDTAENLSNLVQEAGAVKGDIVNESGAMINPNDLSERVSKNVIDPLEQTTVGKKVARTIRDRMEALRSDLGDAPVPASRIEAEKTAEQQGINWLTAPKAESSAIKGYAGELKGAVEDSMGQNPAFLASKRAYGNFKEGANMASRSAGLTDSGTGLMGHMGDVGAAMEGIEGLASGNPIKMATPVVRAMTKGRVSSTLATGANAASKGVQRMTDQYANPVANAISQRLGNSQQAPADSVPQLPAKAREAYINQQIDPNAQEELKRSQE